MSVIDHSVQWSGQGPVVLGDQHGAASQHPTSKLQFQKMPRLMGHEVEVDGAMESGLAAACFTEPTAIPSMPLS